MDGSPNIICTFMVGELFLGLEIGHVREILRYQDMTPVPLAPMAVSGLLNLRGEVVTAIDLRRQLGMPATQPDAMPDIVVVDVDPIRVGLLVDRIEDIVEVGDGRFEDPPDTLDPAARRFIRGVYKLEDRLLAALDVHAATDLGAGGADTRERGRGQLHQPSAPSMETRDS